MIEMLTCPKCLGSAPDCKLCHGRATVTPDTAKAFFLTQNPFLREPVSKYVEGEKQRIKQEFKRRHWNVLRRFIFLMLLYVLGGVVFQTEIWWLMFIVGVPAGFVMMMAAQHWDEV